MRRFAQRYRLALMLAGTSLLLAGGFYAGARWYENWSAAHLPPMAAQLGEVALEQGERCEAAGALEAALAHYQRALAGNFSGAQNRNHAEKRCGIVLYRLGRFSEAAEHLERAQSGPHRSLNGFPFWAKSLIALGRHDEARAAVEKWLNAANGNPEATAAAQQILAEINTGDK